MAISTANGHQERKNRAEQRKRGYQPSGPDWETAHADARPLTLTVKLLVLRASKTSLGGLTLAGLGQGRVRPRRSGPGIELTKELIGVRLLPREISLNLA
jgi:hypothetical protein